MDTFGIAISRSCQTTLRKSVVHYPFSTRLICFNSCFELERTFVVKSRPGIDPIGHVARSTRRRHARKRNTAGKPAAKDASTRDVTHRRHPSRRVPDTREAVIDITPLRAPFPLFLVFLLRLAREFEQLFRFLVAAPGGVARPLECLRSSESPFLLVGHLIFRAIGPPCVIAHPRVPGLRAARRIQFTHADTQSKALSGSLRIVQSRAGCRFSLGRLLSIPASKHDAANNSDVVSNNNREKWHVKVIRDFKVCVSRHF